VKIKQEDGTEIDVLTPEEAQAQADEAAEAARKEAQDAAAAEKAELEEKLKKLEDKDFNFSQFRKKNEKESEDAKKLAGEIETLKQQIGEIKVQPFVKAKEDFIATNKIEGDKELKEKFDFFFEPLASKVKTEADYKAALAGAFAAATGGTRQPSFDGMMVSTRVTGPSNSGGSVSEVSANIGAALNITDEDRKNYGKKNK